MSVCGRVRPLRLFEVLARNRHSAVGRGRRTCSARGKPNRMFTIPPRQQLSSPTQLAIRTRRVTRARIRIRIRIIAHILNKAAAPSYYSSREKHRTHTYTSSTKISSLYTLYAYTKTRKRKSKRERRETKYERDFILEELFLLAFSILSVVLCAFKRST